MTSVYPDAEWLPVEAHGVAMSAHLGLIVHVQAGNGSLRHWFGDIKNNVSSTWWISKSGSVEQYVDADLRAWAQAGGNLVYNSVETEGTPDEPLTDAQIHALAALYRWGVQTYRWPVQLAEQPGQYGLGWHGMGGKAWGGHDHCPGDLRKAQRQQVLDLVRQPTPAQTSQPSPEEDYFDMPAPKVIATLRSPLGGYYQVTPAGTIHPYGGAPNIGDIGVTDFNGHSLNAPIVYAEITPSGRGFLLTGADGGYFNLGDAPAMTGHL